MSSIASSFWIAACLCATSPTSEEPRAQGVPTVASKTEGLTRIDGFVPLHWDAKAGRLFLEIDDLGREFLYQVALATGVGSNPVGLDRGKLGDSRVLTFRRVGPKVLLVEPNQKFRASTERTPERRAVEESFAQSIHWGFNVEAEEEGRLLVDATDFFLRDAQGIAETLRQSRQGTYRLDKTRCALDPERTKGFPRNTEVEAILTFANDAEPGPLVSRTTPAPHSISLRQRHSLIELPELGQGYTPRRPDPRVGVFSIDFYDFATPFDEPVERSWICRHRLNKRDPDAKVGEPVEPIVYHVDSGAPEPIRSALVEGASWWAEAFAAAGFKDAFQVKVLPEDADPMDLRYNVIQWVHRSTRGWSYGNTVIDPRTGEILKGRVTLDSLRARQDALIGSGLAMAEDSPPNGGCAAAGGPSLEHLAALDPETQPGAMVLARIRQLSAHEVGHTLGLAHNFAASACDRASVMDYPAPLVAIKDGGLDLSDAYARGIGPYDVLAIKYAYLSFKDKDNEYKYLDALLTRGVSDGLRFLSDADARPEGAAHPLANLWDNGPDPTASLRREMAVRRIALDRFGVGQLRDGAPLSDLHRKLVPVYLHHRYQLTAALKSLGGVDYNHSVLVAGKPSPPSVAEVVPHDRQRAALRAALDTLSPEFLVLPERLLPLIPPTAFGQGGGTAELFPGSTSPTFDPIACATVAADLAVSGLLQPQRAARLEDHHSRDPRNPGFSEVVQALLQETWDAPRPDDPRRRAIAEAVQTVVAQRLTRLAANESATASVRAIATDALERLSARLGSENPHRRAARDEIRRFLDRPDETNRRSTTPAVPPGDPIGSR
ncbi:MAG: zinc-dependent metalloprotease [Isosphaeraceae bacterium]